jgi:hypothetical protein
MEVIRHKAVNVNAHAFRCKIEPQFLEKVQVVLPFEEYRTSVIAPIINVIEVSGGKLNLSVRHGSPPSLEIPEVWKTSGIYRFFP